MKKLLVPCLALLALTLTPAAFAATAKPSRISAFAGKYTGTLNFGGEATGATTAIFRASKTKESGTLTLTTPLNAGGMSILATETYSFRKHSGAYTLVINESGAQEIGAAQGPVTIGKQAITFSGSIMIGTQPYNVFTKISLFGPKTLVITNTLSGSSTVILSYQLKRKGK